MTSLEYDLRYLRASVELLKDYLLSKDIYWNIGISAVRGAPPYPQLTLGNMLLARARARAKTGSPDQEFNREELERQIDTLHSSWRVAWENKAREEFRARLRLWGNYLDDYRKDSGLHANRYNYEVGRRVLLEMLGAETHDIPEEQIKLLAGMDRLVRAFFETGDFIWDQELADSFPAEMYWYLYGSLQEKII